jgi:hypothetical protein
LQFKVCKKGEIMPEKTLSIEQILKILTESPPRITTITAGVPADQLRETPDFGGWSANEVLAHLRSCSDVWGGCIEAIVTQDTPTLRAVNPTTWIKKTNYLDLEFRSSLQAFTAQRAELLSYLRSLAPQDWKRSATVTGAGKTLVRTVHFYAQWLATHERSHHKPLERIVKSFQT